MSGEYLSLSEELHSVADAAKKCLRDKLGASSFLVEEEIDSSIEYRPTLHGKLPDHHMVCVEVCDGVYSESLDRFVLQARNCALPLKGFVAIDAAVSDSARAELGRRLRTAGLGLIEVENQNTEIIIWPLSLSLASVRTIEPTRFPVKYRQALSEAHRLFVEGEPAKACSKIYDEIEQLTRKLASKIDKMGLWVAGTKTVGIDFTKHSWNPLLKLIRDKARLPDLPCKDDPVTDDLISRCVGITKYRNDAGHKPATRKALAKRDQQLRTRFENAVDLLEDLIIATKAMRI